MNVYALTDGSQTMGIYATETEALAAARLYMASRMWHACQVRQHTLGDTNFSGGAMILWYEECGQMVANVND